MVVIEEFKYSFTSQVAMLSFGVDTCILPAYIAGDLDVGRPL